MRIFVTGASGFIGRRVLPLLADHEVLCLTRQDGKLSEAGSVLTVRGDLARPETWSAQLERFDPEGCIHLAWEGLPDYSLPRCRANLDASLRLIDALARTRVRRIVVAGTCWEYGAATGMVLESRTPMDCSDFASTKHALRTALEAMANETGIEYRWARIFFAYGPGQRSGSLISHCRSAFAAGKLPELREPRVAQDFVHVDDVARGILALTERDAASGIYNLGSGQPSAVGEVAGHVAAYYGAKPPYADTAYDTGFWADVTKTAAATGWRAQITLKDGIARTLRALDETA